MDQMDQSKSVQQANKLKTPIIAQLQIIIDNKKQVTELNFETNLWEKVYSALDKLEGIEFFNGVLNLFKKCSLDEPSPTITYFTAKETEGLLKYFFNIFLQGNNCDIFTPMYNQISIEIANEKKSYSYDYVSSYLNTK